MVFGSFRFVVKGSVAGAAVFVVYEQGLLGSGAQGAEALRKARAALPPAIHEWTSYVGWEVRAAQMAAASSTNTSFERGGGNTGAMFWFQ